MRQLSRQAQLSRVAVAFMVAAAACSSAADSIRPLAQGAADFQTDSASYSLASNGRWYSGTIGVLYTNRTSDAVSFSNCGGTTGVELQKLMDGEWTTVWTPILPACFSAPIVVAPREQRRMDFSVAAGYPGTNTGPQFSIRQISGTYRAVWDEMVVTTTLGAPPAEHRVSNEFALTAPDP